jgi:cell division transport system permease protein
MKGQESKISKSRLRSSYATSIISISLVLFLVGMVGLLVLNAKKISDYVKENIGFSIIVKEDVSEVETIRLQKLLDAKEYVKSTKYVTKEEAAREYKEALGEDFVEFLGYNPLPVSIDVKLYAQYANNDSIKKIEADFKNYPIIKEVTYQESLVHAVNENIRKISIIILIFSGLLFFISIVLINNTIRLSIYSKRFLIRTMQLVGASRNFIRKPFLLKSFLHGSYGALISILLITGLLYISRKEYSEIFILEGLQLVLILFAGILLLGILITFISTYFAVNKYLNIKKDNLYI